VDTPENLFDKKYFPTLKSNPELLYFDNASTTHTHRWVIDRMDKFYRKERCTVHRSDGAINDTVAQEIIAARSRVASLINADADQILFTSGTTQGLNWLAEWYKNIGTVIITEAEHNANVLPWLAQGRKPGDGLEVLPLDYSSGSYPVVDMNKAVDIFNKHQGNALLSVCSHSNLTGTAIGYAHNQSTLLSEAKRHGIITCLDACQTVGHLPVDVKSLDVDWLVFSGHKMYGPMGIGAIYSKQDIDTLRPIMFGGGQVEHMTLNNIVFAPGHYKHEVGTPNIPAILGFGIAAELINFVGYDEIIQREEAAAQALYLNGLFSLMQSNMECVAYNTIPTNQSIYSFVTESHPSDVSTILSQHNVSVRAGKMCAHLLSNHYSDKGLLRISIAPYTTPHECIQLISILNQTFNQLY